MKRRISPIAASIAFLLLAGVEPAPGTAQDLPNDDPPTYDDDDGAPLPSDRTPPRLSHIDGSASFWRQGADEWTQARVNTPLAPGDQLYVDNGSNLELQVGPRDFVRAASNTQLAFDNDDTDYRQFRLTSGQASVDLRGMRAGQTIEVDTPNGAVTIAHDGYYRVEVDEEATHFATRRGGRATVTTANGESDDIGPSEGIVVRGDDVEDYAAGDPDAWDRWNYERSDQLIDAVSYRHVPEAVYGVSDLDHNGRWRSVPRYGSVWFPSRVAAGWSPYTTGRWIYDPYYGWTWIDDAAWGWAPFHYGRWVHVDDFWGWAPGPIVARPYYAPALVAFFSDGPISIGFGIATPVLGWTPLGWGEPCRPWWGSRRFLGRPQWFGWGGPRVAFHQTAIRNDVRFYQNTRVRNGLVVMDGNEFGRGPVSRGRFGAADIRRLRPIEGSLPVRADGVRVVGGTARGHRPPESMLDRRVVATRASAAPSGGGFFRRSDAPPNPPAQLVPPPRSQDDRRRWDPPQHGASSQAARPAGRSGVRSGGTQHVDRSIAAPAPPHPSQAGVDRREQPRAESRSFEPPRTGRQQQAARWPQGMSPRASREMPAQVTQRGRDLRSGAGPTLSPMPPTRSRGVERQERAHGRRDSGAPEERRLAAEQPPAAPDPATSRPDFRGRGRR